MKTIKSLSKVIISLILALALTTLTACDVLDDFFGKGEGGTGDGNVYQVTLEDNGGTFTENVTEYTSGTACTLPTNGTKAHYTFGGWYADSGFSGNKVTKIPTGATGDKTYYAKWDPETYDITYSIKGDASFSSDITSYTYNTLTKLPAPEKDGYTFDGWYTKSDLSDSKVTQIAVGEYGEKTFYGEWVSTGTPDKPTISEVVLNLDGGNYVKGGLTEYTEGIETPLPDAVKDGYTFNGWIDSKGSVVRSIPATATGAQAFTASWTKISTGDLQLTAFGGYEEGAYVEFDTVSGVANYTVKYKDSTSGTAAYKSIDNNLIRVNNGKVRADIVGLKAGTYNIQVSAGNKTTVKTVTVTSYDRSGYAHFDSKAGNKIYSSGVGAYNNDGTPKDNANIVYVSEENKNSNFNVEGNNYTGIVGVLKNAKNLNNPLIVRIIGTISAATWKKDNVVYTKTTDNTQDGKITGKLKASVIVGKNGKQLPTDASQLTQEALISGGYNELETGITVLKGLSSSASYKSNDDENKCEWDSCWNDCQIDSAKNVTVEGIGTDAMIFQWGLTWKKCSSIEVRNITFDDYTEDACSFEGSTDTTYTGMSVDKFNSNRLWVHHNVFNQGINYWDVCAEQDKHEGDGATDFKRCAYISIAYNHYYNNHKTGLIGADDNVFTANVTFHHNYYDQCSSRLPLARQANMHMYNNYYFKSSGTNMSIRSGAYAFIENCYFENANNPIQTQLGSKSIKLDNKDVYLDGYVKVYNCTFIETGVKNDYKLNTSKYNITQVSKRTDLVTNENIYNKNFDTSASAFYYDSTNNVSNVTKLDETADVPEVVKQYAGVHKN